MSVFKSAIDKYTFTKGSVTTYILLCYTFWQMNDVLMQCEILLTSTLFSPQLHNL